MSFSRNAGVLALPLAAFGLLAWKFDFLCDDAFISFRYAKNLSEGHGLRYNLGEDPPVEGYSNFLWVLWLALLHRIGFAITLASRVTSIACGAILVAWVTGFAARRFALPAWKAFAVGLFTATLPPIALWATGGLETMATTLFVFASFERLLGDRERPHGLASGVFAALAALTRADGAAFAALLLGAATLVWLFEGRPQALGRALLASGSILVLCVAAHIAWRLSYYGALVPNTARVKAGGSFLRIERGLDYLATFLLTLPSIALVLATALRRWERVQRSVWIPAAAIACGTFGYAVWVGGDHQPFGRYLMPSMPFVALLFAGTLGARRAPAGAGLAVLCVGLSLGASVDRNAVPDEIRARFNFRRGWGWESEIAFLRRSRRSTAKWTLEGKALRHCTQPDESIILGPVGAIGYYSELTVYDVYGLVSPEVAESAVHSDNAPGHDVAVDPSFFLHHRPTYFGAKISRVDARDASLTENWFESPYHDMVRVDRCPLPQGEGFPPGTELRLLRFHRWDFDPQRESADE